MQLFNYAVSDRLHVTFKAWRSADNSISSAGTVDFLFKVQGKIFLMSKVPSPNNCSKIVK